MPNTYMIHHCVQVTPEDHYFCFLSVFKKASALPALPIFLTLVNTQRLSTLCDNEFALW